MGSVRTSIFGRPRHLSVHRHANGCYTLICEEPVNTRLMSILKNTQPPLESNNHGLYQTRGASVSASALSYESPTVPTEGVAPISASLSP